MPRKGVVLQDPDGRRRENLVPPEEERIFFPLNL
jgi:hypothetical protein